MSCRIRSSLLKVLRDRANFGFGTLDNIEMAANKHWTLAGNSQIAALSRICPIAAG